MKTRPASACRPALLSTIAAPITPRSTTAPTTVSAATSLSTSGSMQAAQAIGLTESGGRGVNQSVKPQRPHLAQRIGSGR